MGVDVADFDRDGDLDLFLTHIVTETNTLYENVDGTLGTSPVWISNATNRTEDVAWGDLDRDGNLDLVCGNDGGGLTMWYRNDGMALRTIPTSSNMSSDARSGAMAMSRGEPLLTASDPDGDEPSHARVFPVREKVTSTPAWLADSSLALATRLTVAGPKASNER